MAPPARSTVRRLIEMEFIVVPFNVTRAELHGVRVRWGRSAVTVGRRIDRGHHLVAGGARQS